MLDIVIDIPIWFWLSLILLVFLGAKQTRSRQLSKNKIFILPVVMIVFSFQDVILNFGDDFDWLFYWAVSFVSALLISVLMFPSKSATFDESTQCYFIKGSWWPLLLILAIFPIKYSIWMMDVMQSSYFTSSLVEDGVPLFYGVLSGVFTARSIVLVLSRPTQTYNSP